MKTKIPFLFLSLLSIYPLATKSQSTFIKTFGGFANDEGHDIVELPDGGFLITGADGSRGDTSFDAYLLKISGSGERVWEKSFGGNFQDGGNEMAATPDGKYFVAGHTESFGKGDCEAYFFLMDTHGDTLWTRNYGTWGDDAAYGAAVGDNGHYYAVGMIENGDNGSDGFLIEFSPSGSIIRTNLFGGAGMDYFTQIRNTNDGNFMIAGRTYKKGNSDFWLMKVDTAGNIIWDKTYGTTENEDECGLTQSADGGFLLTGKSSDPEGTIASLYYLRTNSNGDSLWSKRILNSPGCAVSNAVQTIDNFWVACGDAYNEATNSMDAFLMKLNDNGEVLWTKYFGGTDIESGWRMTQCSNGDFVFTGYTLSSGAGMKDVFVVRANPNGDVTTSVDDPKAENYFSIYPNPFSDYTYFDVNNAGAKSINIVVYDVHGKIVELFTDIQWGRQTFERDNLLPGIYLVEILDKSGILQTKKLIAQ